MEALLGKHTVKLPKAAHRGSRLDQQATECRATLLRNLKAQLPELKKLRAKAHVKRPQNPIDPFDARSLEEHYQLQPMIQKIADALQKLLPDRALEKQFSKIVEHGTDREFASLDPVKGARDAMAILAAYDRAEVYLNAACEAGQAGRLSSPETCSTLFFLFDLNLR